MYYAVSLLLAYIVISCFLFYINMCSLLYIEFGNKGFLLLDWNIFEFGLLFYLFIELEVLFIDFKHMKSVLFDVYFMKFIF